MPSVPNPGDIFDAVKTAASGIVQQDVTTLSPFVQDQLKRIEQNGILFAQMELAGEFIDDPDRRREYLGIVEDLARNFVNTVRALIVVEIEKLWNAVVKVLWDVLDKATGLALPRPL
jgi:hypothetical protein